MSTRSRIDLYVDRWSAWEPGGDGPARSFSGSGDHVSATALAKPELSQVPPLQRRRLGALARVVFQVLANCVRNGGSEPVVFSSLMGEIQRTQDLLDAIADEAAVSPAAFSLSVHNAIAGLWTLVNDIQAPMIALSPINGSPLAALLEAAGMLREGDCNALTVVFYEEAYPAFYSPWLGGPLAPCALALRLLGPDHDQAVTRRFALAPAMEPAAVTADGPLALLPLLRGDCASIALGNPGGDWELERRQ